MSSVFAQAVYNACSKIPRGRVATYSEIARAIARPRAVRAVGTALKHNPKLICVPCHRVVKSSGAVGEYARGAQQKVALLLSEGICIKQGKIQEFETYLFRL